MGELLARDDGRRGLPNETNRDLRDSWYVVCERGDGVDAGDACHATDGQGKVIRPLRRTRLLGGDVFHPDLVKVNHLCLVPGVLYCGHDGVHAVRGVDVYTGRVSKEVYRHSTHSRQDGEALRDRRGARRTSHATDGQGHMIPGAAGRRGVGRCILLL